MRFATLIIIFCLTCCRAMSQLCTGSLGDPVALINFGTGLNPGPALPNGQTSYFYFSNDCPGDGYYTITNKSSSCFGDSWLTYTEDHTSGDVNGYFMLVNASIEPGDFYLDTVDGLCGSTTYEFSAWITNVVKTVSCSGNSIKPNLTFRIENTNGTVLNTYNTGDIAATASTQWKQYGTFFSTDAGINSVVIRLRNNAPGGCGNDLALDDITFRPCGPAINTAFIKNNESTLNACEGDATAFKITASYSGGYTNPVLQWQQSVDGGISWQNILNATKDTLTIKPALSTGIYYYRVAISEKNNQGFINCSVFSLPAVLQYNSRPVASLAANFEGCENTTVTLQSSGGASYLWSGANGYSSVQQNAIINNAKPGDSGTYTLVVFSDKQCTDTAETFVTIKPAPVFNLGNDTSFCEGDSLLLNVSGSGDNYLWQDGSATSFYTIHRQGLYFVNITKDGCSAADSLQAFYTLLPQPNLGADTVICDSQPLTLNTATNSPGYIYLWQDGSTETTFTTYQPGKFSVTVTNTCGRGYDEINVSPVSCNVAVPTAFTPNNDGLNDILKVLNAYLVKDFQFVIFNRFGQKIFESTNPLQGWNGKLKGFDEDRGTYIYTLQYTDKVSNQPVFKKGYFVLLR